MDLRKQSSAYVGMQLFLIKMVHPYVWQSGRKLRQAGWHRRMNLSACPSSKCIKLQGQAVLRVAMSHARTNQKTVASSSLESERIMIWTYTANAATITSPLEMLQPKAANLSAWRIATVKKRARTNQ